MSRILFFDAFNGLAGDMILGSLLHLGLPLELLRESLELLDVSGFELSAERVKRSSLLATDFKVITESTPSSRHHHEPHHHHGHSPSPYETYVGIRRLIQQSRLSESVREMALGILQRLASAEAEVHGTELEKVHFHEVGAIDSVVDIVGACVGFEYFAVEEFYCSAINLGGGKVHFSHGTWPVPAPATAGLLKGFPVYLSAIDAELTTPTGAAIVSSLVDPSRPVPAFTMESAGLGAGDREIKGIPNVLRLLLGRKTEETRPVASTALQTESVVLLEASIDDMDAEMFGYFLEVALEKGALDVYCTPVQMKKSRPGHLLSLLCRPEDKERMAELVFRETTTLGLRFSEQSRWILDRESICVRIPAGEVSCKVSRYGDRVVGVTPEYEDLRRLARASGCPLREIRREIDQRIAELPLWERNTI